MTVVQYRTVTPFFIDPSNIELLDQSITFHFLPPALAGDTLGVILKCKSLHTRIPTIPFVATGSAVKPVHTVTDCLLLAIAVDTPEVSGK